MYCVIIVEQSCFKMKLKTCVKMKNLENEVYSFPTKNKEGFTYAEIKKLLENYPNIDQKKFDGAMMVNTCTIIDNETVIYHCDVLTALRCGVEKRNMKPHEFD